jgi:hypothetical protein
MDEHVEDYVLTLQGPSGYEVLDPELLLWPGPIRNACAVSFIDT